MAWCLNPVDLWGSLDSECEHWDTCLLYRASPPDTVGDYIYRQRRVYRDSVRPCRILGALTTPGGEECQLSATYTDDTIASIGLVIISGKGSGALYASMQWQQRVPYVRIRGVNARQRVIPSAVIRQALDR